MTSSCKPREEDLRSDTHGLLLAAEAGQEADILTSSSGHLGPRSLNQSPPQREVEKSVWRRSQGNEGAPGRPLKSDTCKILGESEVTRSKKDQTDSSPHADNRDEDTSQPETDSSSQNSLHAQQKTFKSSPDPEKELEDRSRSNQEGLKNEGQCKTKQSGRLETAKAELWAGNNIAEKHERKLQKELQKLSEHSRPSRDRLAVFSDVFDDVCESSPVFGRILREIKTDYDLYVNHLMASQPQDTSLKASPEDVCSSKLREMQLEDAGKEVQNLEQEVRGALEENKRARNDLQKLTANKGLEESDVTDPSLSALRDRRTDVSVQSKRLQLFNIWREIQHLEEMEERLVPEAVIAAADRQTKDAKREIMRLIATNHRLEAANKAKEFDLLPPNDLKDSINTLLDREKASKDTRRKLWEEVQSDLLRE